MHFFQWDAVIKLKNGEKSTSTCLETQDLELSTILYTLHTTCLIFMYVLRPFTIALYIPLNYCVPNVNSF